MATPKFELITELQACIRRDFPLAVPAILNPLDAAALVEGEWLELDSANTYLLKRGTGAGTSGAVFPVHTERGRYDTQSIQKVNVIFAGQYEAETMIHDAGSANIGDPLMVDSVTIGGVSRRGLKVATTGKAVVGFVTKITGTGSAAKVRFLHTGTYIAA